MFNYMKLLAFILTVAVFSGCGFFKKPATEPAKIVVATVNGIEIADSDIEEKIKPELNKFEMELFKTKKEAVDEVIEEKLIELAGKKENKTPEVFLRDYFEANIQAPTEEEIKQFYDVRKKQLGDKSIEEAKEQIIQFLNSNKRNALKTKLINDLKATADIKVLLQPPRIEINTDNSPSKGPETAPITIVEFTDYQCPFCGKARPTLDKIFASYPDKVRHVLKDYPLSFHKNARKAHEAAYCAGDQGKYWEMYKLLFENQSALTVNDLKRYAANLGLDTAMFNKCLDEGVNEKKVTENIIEARIAGVVGTPSFFINGIMVSGARPYSDFKEIIDNELTRKN